MWGQKWESGALGEDGGLGGQRIVLFMRVEI